MNVSTPTINRTDTITNQKFIPELNKKLRKYHKQKVYSKINQNLYKKGSNEYNNLLNQEVLIGIFDENEKGMDNIVVPKPQDDTINNIITSGINNPSKRQLSTGLINKELFEIKSQNSIEGHSRSGDKNELKSNRSNKSFRSISNLSKFEEKKISREVKKLDKMLNSCTRKKDGDIDVMDFINSQKRISMNSKSNRMISNFGKSSHRLSIRENSKKRISLRVDNLSIRENDNSRRGSAVNFIKCYNEKLNYGRF